MARVQIGVNVDLTRVESALNRVMNNDRTMIAIHETLKKRCDPYVPMREGPLSQGARVDAEGVHYSEGAASEYAAYQYYGEVYGPSWPIYQDGVIVGWRSPAGKGSKHPTGRKLSYSKDRHPLATSFWDKAMLRDHRDEFTHEVEEIIRRDL